MDKNEPYFAEKTKEFLEFCLEVYYICKRRIKIVGKILE